MNFQWLSYYIQQRLIKSINCSLTWEISNPRYHVVKHNMSQSRSSLSFRGILAKFVFTWHMNLLWNNGNITRRKSWQMKPTKWDSMWIKIPTSFGLVLDFASFWQINSSQRADGAIQLRFNVDPAFYSLVRSRIPYPATQANLYQNQIEFWCVQSLWKQTLVF